MCAVRTWQNHSSLLGIWRCFFFLLSKNTYLFQSIKCSIEKNDQIKKKKIEQKNLKKRSSKKLEKDVQKSKKKGKKREKNVRLLIQMVHIHPTWSQSCKDERVIKTNSAIWNKTIQILSPVLYCERWRLNGKSIVSLSLNTG